MPGNQTMRARTRCLLFSVYLFATASLVHWRQASATTRERRLPWSNRNIFDRRQQQSNAEKGSSNIFDRRQPESDQKAGKGYSKKGTFTLFNDPEIDTNKLIEKLTGKGSSKRSGPLSSKDELSRDGKCAMK